jgi:hypothetical protein
MLALFAQAAGNGNMNNDDELDPEGLAILVVVFGMAFVIWLVITGFFLLTLSRTLTLCRPKNRAMEPGAVWFNLIPVFNIIWLFVTVMRVGESLKQEFRSRGWRTKENFGQTLGIVLAVFSVLNCGCYIGGLIPLVLFIVYWSKIAGYKRQLAEPYDDDEGEDSWDDEGVEDQDRPRERRTDEDHDRPREPWEDENDDRDDRPRNRR